MEHSLAGGEVLLAVTMQLNFVNAVMATWVSFVKCVHLGFIAQHLIFHVTAALALQLLHKIKHANFVSMKSSISKLVYFSLF